MASTQEKIWWKERMCATWKFELKKHLCEKRGQLLKKVSKYQNIKIANNSSIKWGSWTCVVTYWFEKIMDVSTFVLYFQFEIYWGSWFKFLIRNFTVVLIRNFFRDWEPEFLKQPHRYFSGNWRNWWKNKSALGIKYLHRKRKRKTNHTLVKPSSRFSFHKPSPCQV